MEENSKTSKCVGQGWDDRSKNFITLSLNKEELMKIEADERFGEIKVVVGKRLEPSKGSKSNYFVKTVN
jgi:hypothetical protein